MLGRDGAAEERRSRIHALGSEIELMHDLVEGDWGLPVDNDAHRALVAVGAEEHDRVVKVRIVEGWRGDDEARREAFKIGDHEESRNPGAQITQERSRGLGDAMIGRMFEMETLRFASSLALVRGLRQLRHRGIRGRSLLFLALSERGEAHLAIDGGGEGKRAPLKVGEKLTLDPPFAGRVFYFDAVHPLGHRTAIVNGDRRIGYLANLVDAAELVSGYVEEMDEESVFFGCTPHQPGSWWVNDTEAIPLHARGFVDIVPVKAGFLARRTVDAGLYFLPAASAIAGDVKEWRRVFDSPLGNILLVERRAKRGRLVLSCQRGLTEVDISGLPRVLAVGTIAVGGGHAVLGRITEGGFAVSRGIARDWGFDDLGPASLVGSRGDDLKALGKLLARGI